MNTITCELLPSTHIYGVSGHVAGHVIKVNALLARPDKVDLKVLQEVQRHIDCAIVALLSRIQLNDDDEMMLKGLQERRGAIASALGAQTVHSSDFTEELVLSV